MTKNSFENLKTVFPKVEEHKPQVYVIDARGKTLGRLASLASIYLRGKITSFYTPGVDQGNFVIILNAKEIKVSGKKNQDKTYVRTSQRPGSLKSENFAQLQQRLPTRILEKSIWGMLPKGVLGRNYYKRLFVYSDSNIPVKSSYEKNKYTKTKIDFFSVENINSKNWILIP